MERVEGVEPSAFCLGSRHSTAELHPHMVEALGVEPRSEEFHNQKTTRLSGSLDLLAFDP